MARGRIPAGANPRHMRRLHREAVFEHPTVTLTGKSFSEMVLPGWGLIGQCQGSQHATKRLAVNTRVWFEEIQGGCLSSGKRGARHGHLSPARRLKVPASCRSGDRILHSEQITLLGFGVTWT